MLLNNINICNAQIYSSFGLLFFSFYVEWILYRRYG